MRKKKKWLLLLLKTIDSILLLIPTFNAPANAILRRRQMLKPFKANHPRLKNTLTVMRQIIETVI